MQHDINRIRRAEGTGPWLHEPRRQPRPRWCLRRIAIGAVIGASFPLLAVTAATIIQTIGTLL